MKPSGGRAGTDGQIEAVPPRFPHRGERSMRRRARFNRGTWTLVFGVAAAVGLAATARAEGPRGSRLVGPEAVIYAESSHPDAVIDRVTGERFRALLAAIPGY